MSKMSTIQLDLLERYNFIYSYEDNDYKPTNDQLAEYNEWVNSVQLFDIEEIE